MEPATDIEAALLPAQDVRELSIVSSWRAIAQGLLEWMWIVLIIVVALRIDMLVLYPLWVLLIASRQHALAILMHDGAHGRLHPDARWNELFGELFLAWPLLTSMKAYRRTHLGHHRHLQTPKDADWRLWRDYSYYWFPKRRGELLREILAFTLGLRTLELLAFLRQYANRSAKPARADAQPLTAREAFQRALGRWRWPLCGVLLAAIVLAGAGPVLLFYWFVPKLTALMGMLYIRAIAEHFISEHGGPSSLACSRSMHYNLVERLLLAPLNVGYHLEHHLYPAVPFYRLGELHRRLMAVEHFREHAHITRGVRGVVEECANSRSTRELWERQGAAAS